MLKSDQSSEALAAENTYAKATKAELARNYDEAFKLYVQATEAFLHLTRTSHQSEAVHTKWKNNATKALERAEKIKAFSQKSQRSGVTSRAGDGGIMSASSPAAGGSSSSATNVRLTPIGINHFAKSEQYYALKRGTRINGLNFPLWDDLTATYTGPSVFTDPDGQPHLSPEQQRVSAVWRRPDHFTQPDQIIGKRKILPQEILQHIVTDCSVCASISVCLEHARRFGSDLARAPLHGASGIPIFLESQADALSADSHAVSQSGRYDVKMLINGAWRRVLIDDTLPYDPSDGSLMCMFAWPQDDEKHEKQTVYWPSLLEKSYMKLMGGYDFPGSNSSIDLHAFAGWVPEQIETKGSSFEREKTWERLLNGFRNGQCVVTLGTGPRRGIQWRDIPLLESHSYAVIDIAETEEDRLLTVLDSWVRPEDKQSSRVLQIPWSEVLYVFDGIYLSWDPKTWAHEITFHGMWKRGGQEDEDGNQNIRINFVNTNAQTEEEIWVLLTRHITDTRRTNDFICLRTEIEGDLLTGSAPRSVEQRGISAKGTYTNNTHVLARARIVPSHRSGALNITASYEGDTSEIGFTIIAYASRQVEISWDETVPPSPFSIKVEGTLTSKNAGGNCAYPTFMVNPQYHLRIYPPKGAVVTGPGISKKSRAKLMLKASKDAPVNVVVVWSQGDRKYGLIEQEIAATSGAYTYGLAQVTKDLTPGDYTVIISAFEPHHVGPYALRVECSTSFDFKSIPQEGAGMYSKVVHGAWNSATAAGGPSFQRYSRNPKFELEVPVSAQIRVRLQLLNPTKVTSTSLNATIIYSTSSSALSSHVGTNSQPSPQKQGPVATSGAYDDALSGVATPLVTLGKGKYDLVPSTYSPGVQAEFRLIVYSSAAGVEVRRIR